MIISPDGKWIAFRERFHIYLAPYPQTGKPLKLGPKMSSLPVVRLTRDSGFGLHWSADSRTVYWTLGAELYSRELKDSFDFVEGAPDSLPEPDSAGVALGWQENAEQPSGKLALMGARIITLDKTGVVEEGAVLIENNRIAAVGPSSEVKIPLMARKIDLSGKTIIPGLVDVHAHLGLNRDGLTVEQNWNYLANLAFGVTTTHDPSNDTEMIFANSELQKAGRILAPRLFSTGMILYGAHGQLQGLGVHWEMWMLAQGGMTPLEALQASTINGATYLGMEADLGSLAAGKLADLVVLEKNPREDIHNSDSVLMVMLNGRLYDAATLNEIAPGKQKRKPLWWE